MPSQQRVAAELPFAQPEVGPHVRGFVGWLVWSRPPAQQLDHIIVTDEDGKTLANRPLPYGTTGSRGWDVTLKQLGFDRLGGWTPTTGGFACRLQAR